MKFFATCPKLLEELLARELSELGGSAVRQSVAGVEFEGELALGLRACLWSRLASRVLLPLFEITDVDNETLYQSALDFPWEDHLDPRGSLAIDAHGTNTALRHSQYSAQRLKDGICDRLRRLSGQRPEIERDQPDLRINLRIHGSHGQVSLDLAGSPLHQRGYRSGSNEAPLKENLAAALLLRAGWPALASAGGALVDPFCGSGTLLIEGAWIAADLAPGRLRNYFGFLGWRGFDATIWRQLREEADARAAAGNTCERPRCFGSDSDAAIIDYARTNAEAAGVGAWIEFHTQPVAELRPPTGFANGLVITNPPYGERMGEATELAPSYQQFGQALRDGFAGWQAALITSAPELARATGLRASRHHAFMNGAIECRLYRFEPGTEKSVYAEFASERPLSEAALGLANRLKKNLRLLKPRLQRAGISCYRAYDADLPDYAAAIDVYENHLHIQEYAAPKDVPEALARRRFNEIIRVAAEAFELPREQITEKTRHKRQRLEQYQRQDQQGQFFWVGEGGLRFRVNLTDYLDTGLFLDHRPLRERVRKSVHGLRFLNLFCYTGAVTVYAAAGGAAGTVSVDLSHTYLDWAEANLVENALAAPRHRLVQGDAMRFIEADHGEYDLIYVDPPTFSNSKSAADFDVQRDHVRLLNACAARLAADGLILFSNNFRRFKINAEALPALAIRDISPDTIPFDFARDPKIHHCFEIRHAKPVSAAS